MRTITLFLCAALAVTSVNAASYQTINGTIVDPFDDLFGNIHPYSGNNLQPAANLTGAFLSHAVIAGANLYGAFLNSANLTNANLYSADLSYADLSHADLTGARIWNTDLSDADLSGSILTDTQDYIDATWTDAFYYTDNEPTWDSGMDAAWRSSVGILALAPVPEPAAILLALFGLALLPRRRRR